jgi:hypothetical protein
MLEFKIQGTALICHDDNLNHEYEIQESENGKFALRVDGEVIHFFDNKEYAQKVASLIEEDFWN